MAMVIHLFPGWVNAGENGGSKLVKKTLFRGSMLVVIYTKTRKTEINLALLTIMHSLPLKNCDQ